MVKTKPSFIRLLLLAFFALIAAFAFMLSAQSQETEAPEDFEITLFSAPVFKGGQPGPYGVVISRDGTASFYTQDLDGEIIFGKTVSMEDGAVDALYRVVTQQEFFSLKADYNDPGILDGDYAVIVVTMDGQTHEVRTTNIRLAPFDKIALWVNSYFDPDNMILYNAFVDRELEEATR